MYKMRGNFGGKEYTIHCCFWYIYFRGFLENLVWSRSDVDRYYFCETAHEPKYIIEETGVSDNGWMCKTGERHRQERNNSKL